MSWATMIYLAEACDPLASILTFIFAGATGLALFVLIISMAHAWESDDEEEEEEEGPNSVPYQRKLLLLLVLVLLPGLVCTRLIPSTNTVYKMIAAEYVKENGAKHWDQLLELVDKRKGDSK